MTTWHRIPEGYASADGRAVVIDNGPGLGPARGSKRWAAELDSRWLANVDYLADAKALLEERLARVAFTGRTRAERRDEAVPMLMAVTTEAEARRIVAAANLSWQAARGLLQDWRSWRAQQQG